MLDSRQAIFANVSRFLRLALLCCATWLFSLPLAYAQSPQSVRGVTIVLPPKLIAAQPATLAVVGNDGRLAPNVGVDLAPDMHVTTDRNGRAFFTVPASAAFLVANASGSFAAALVDVQRNPSAAISVPPVISLHDRFAICGMAFGNDPDANRVKINGEFALVMAASPECIVAAPDANAMPGAAKILTEAPGPQASFIAANLDATFVALGFSAPNPPLQPGSKSRFSVIVQGSQQSLRLSVSNTAPGVLEFRSGDAQVVRTTGGPQNAATFEVKAVRAGDFSFRARVLPAPDPVIAARFLEAAESVAPKNLKKQLKSLAARAVQHPKDAEKIQRELSQLLATPQSDDLRALLEAAASAL